MKVIQNNDGSILMITENSLSKEQVDTLKAVDKKGRWEFRDYGDSDKDYCREGILKASVCDQLLELGLLEMDDMSWHTTFRITDKGKELLSLF